MPLPLFFFFFLNYLCFREMKDNENADFAVSSQGTLH